jgi:prepilin peptidase CpaA
MSGLQPLVTLIGTLVLVWAAAWVDFRTFRIPNALVVSGAAFGLLAQVWGAGWEGLGQGLAGLGVGLALLFPVYVLSHMGAGDVKLMGAVGALLGLQRLPLALLFTVLAAGAMGAVYVVRAWRARGAQGPWRRYGQMLRFLLATGRPSYVPPAPDEAMAERLPLAVPIAIGTTAAALWPL